MLHTTQQITNHWLPMRQFLFSFSSPTFSFFALFCMRPCIQLGPNKNKTVRLNTVKSIGDTKSIKKCSDFLSFFRPVSSVIFCWMTFIVYDFWVSFPNDLFIFGLLDDFNSCMKFSTWIILSPSSVFLNCIMSQSIRYTSLMYFWFVRSRWVSINNFLNRSVFCTNNNRFCHQL